MVGSPEGVSQFEIRACKAVGDHTAPAALFYAVLRKPAGAVAGGLGRSSPLLRRRCSRSSQAGDLRLAAIACWMRASNSLKESI